MNVSERMIRGVQSCSVHDSLLRAAQIMWDGDCDCVPVVDDDERVVGIVTDLDICVTGYTQGRVYAEIPVSAAMARQVVGVNENELVEAAEALMRDRQVVRLLVLDGRGRLRGVVSLNDRPNSQPGSGLGQALP